MSSERCFDTTSTFCSFELKDKIAGSAVTAEPAIPLLAEEDWLDEEFDLEVFFSDDHSDQNKGWESKVPQENDFLKNPELQAEDLLTTLKQESTESLRSFAGMSEQAFSLGATLSSSVFSQLSSLVGSCGVFCAHGLSSLTQMAGPGLSTPLSSFSGSGLSLDSHGHLHFAGDWQSLSHATGLPIDGLQGGKFSHDEILMGFFRHFAEGICWLFGFGMLGDLMDTLFANFTAEVEAY